MTSIFDDLFGNFFFGRNFQQHDVPETENKQTAKQYQGDRVLHETRRMDFNKLNWRPTYKLQEVSFSIKSAPTDQGDKEILIIKAGSFHEEEFSIFQLMGKVPNLSLYHGNTKLICQTIFEYLLKNAMFPYPVEELY